MFDTDEIVRLCHTFLPLLFVLYPAQPLLVHQAAGPCPPRMRLLLCPHHPHPQTPSPQVPRASTLVKEPPQSISLAGGSLGELLTRWILAALASKMEIIILLNICSKLFLKHHCMQIKYYNLVQSGSCCQSCRHSEYFIFVSLSGQLILKVLFKKLVSSATVWWVFIFSRINSTLFSFIYSFLKVLCIVPCNIVDQYSLVCRKTKKFPLLFSHIEFGQKADSYLLCWW